jgi:pantetheine-phosphate adenylyltransferase
LSLIERASHLFDEVVVAVSRTPSKNLLFTYEERLKFMTIAVGGMRSSRNIQVIGFDGLLAQLVKKIRATAIIRGLRAVSDFEYEFQMALMNRKLAREAETVFLMPSLSWVYLSSSIVKEVARNNGDVNGLVPTVVKRALITKFKTKA